MKTNHFLTLGSLILTLACPLSATADWQGDLSMKGGPDREMVGKIHGKKNAVRMDLKSPRGEMSFISDLSQRKAWNLMHAQKMVMEISLDKTGVHMPRCESGDVDGCLSQEGFKKTGSESVNGHPCAVYEKNYQPERGRGEATHVKLWRPTDLKEVPFVRTNNTGAKGHTTQLDLTNVKVVGTLAASLFTPPRDYRSMQMPDMSAMAGMQNGQMSPAQMKAMRDAMIKQMQQQQNAEQDAE